MLRRQTVGAVEAATARGSRGVATKLRKNQVDPSRGPSRGPPVRSINSRREKGCTPWPRQRSAATPNRTWMTMSSRTMSGPKGWMCACARSTIANFANRSWWSSSRSRSVLRGWLRRRRLQARGQSSSQPAHQCALRRRAQHAVQRVQAAGVGCERVSSQGGGQSGQTIRRGGAAGRWCECRRSSSRESVWSFCKPDVLNTAVL